MMLRASLSNTSLRRLRLQAFLWPSATTSILALPETVVTLTGSSLRSEPNQRRADGMADAGNGQKKKRLLF